MVIQDVVSAMDLGRGEMAQSEEQDKNYAKEQE
jgi:hypothetical protein